MDIRNIIGTCAVQLSP